MTQHEATGRSVLPVPGLPLFGACDSLSKVIAAALINADVTLPGGDVFIVAQKIVARPIISRGKKGHVLAKTGIDASKALGDEGLCRA